MQIEHPGAGKVLIELRHILRRSATEAVDGLLGITHDPWGIIWPAQLLQQDGDRTTDILIFINQHPRIFFSIALDEQHILVKNTNRASNAICKVDVLMVCLGHFVGTIAVEELTGCSVGLVFFRGWLPSGKFCREPLRVVKSIF